MTSDEIRETFLQFFEAQDHLRLPSFSLVPSAFDPSALFTVAGMHPLKPYFQGVETPPRERVTTCQKTFRTVDIEIIGTTSRHLSFFEMLGNFSFGDYFKRDAARFAWELSTQGFGLDPDHIWVTVFAGDDELGLGADEDAIAAWTEIGFPRERIVECPRSENFWESGPTGPCGPCSELYLDRTPQLQTPTRAEDLPGGENERFLEFWNLVFMQMDQNPRNVVSPLPRNNIDTGLGLNRMAAVLQGRDTVFETDQFAPLIALGEQLSGRRYGADFPTDKGLRLLADHSRAISFLLADGVVPSNEDRGYVLRRIMRRAIQHGRGLELDPGFLERYAEVVTETMGAAYPELHAQASTIRRWLAAEEESFGRTLESGLARLDELIARARDADAEGIAGADAFLLHDTYGFPIDMTLEIVAEHGLGVDEAGFEALMTQQRNQSREGSSGRRTADSSRERAAEFSGGAGFATEFVGYETTDAETTIGAVRLDSSDPAQPRLLVKLRESPFYATGGGQVADDGVIECEGGGCRARVTDVIRLGTDQVVELAPEHGSFEPGQTIHAHVDHAARHATACNHTATHLLHAALRLRLGEHVHQAGSYVGPDKLRFDFTHSSGLSAQELADVADEVNRRIVEALPVRALTTTLDEARALGAMALFNEKYGDVVRMVEIGDADAAQRIVSRELCGGTHVRSTAEIGLLRIITETSSAANVRRVEAITGPAAVAFMRTRDRELEAAAEVLRVPGERVAHAAGELRDRVRDLERRLKRGAAPGNGGGVDLDALIAGAREADGAHVLTAAVDGAADADALLALADRLKGRLGDAAIVLGRAGDGRVDLIASVAPALVQRGVRAGEIVKLAAAEVGGGGGGRDTMARAGGRDPEQLPAALSAARAAIEAALAG
jgi:alanyl-tRNA synthetase